ncbi:VOC family protein [Nocardiopsis sp. RSe5-2]|uniref:VOC family protein n=1 Tax=Nocardiopsis endophytica TaxID=3018445 RepID=A0ABT4U042_9ACTN|nr:VOC family protein [Nocardiopsis endophytica]MDA2809840.1 VOC family protein [Nocardiopsis endophytica]
MGIRFSALSIDAVDPRAVAGFWSSALGWPVAVDTEEGIGLVPEEGAPLSDFGIVVLPVPPGERKQVKNRLHLDLRPSAGSTAEEELQRLVGLGATLVQVGQPDDAPWTVLADPEGNEFCLLHRGDPADT